jgi:hypothetical protein
MVTRVGFGSLEAGQMVSILAGEDDQGVVLPAYVVSASYDAVELQLAVRPFHRGVLGQSAEVHVICPDGRVDRARVTRPEGQYGAGLTLAPIVHGVLTENQRSYDRFSTLAMEAQAITHGIDHTDSFRVQILDLSGGGARLLAPDELHESDALELHLPAPDGGEEIHVRARVVWVRGLFQSWLAGVQFAELPQVQRDVIARTIQQMRWVEHG